MWDKVLRSAPVDYFDMRYKVLIVSPISHISHLISHIESAPERVGDDRPTSNFIDLTYR